MPPKRRVVKTVRRITTRSKSKQSPAATAAAAPASDAEETPASPPPQPPTTSASPEPSATASAPPDLPTPSPSATALETPLPEPVEPTSPPFEIPPETAAPAAVPDTSVVHPPPAAEEPQPPAAAKKTTVRVRKVIKKKIVKKRVPKVVPAAKKELDSSQPPAETAAEVETPSSEPGPENPSSNADSGEATQAENADSVEEQPVKREQDKELGQEMAASEEEEEEEQDAKGEQHKEIGQEVASAEEKDVQRDQDKEMVQEMAAAASTVDEEAGMSERQKRRKTEIFIGGLGRDAKEDDLRNVFGKVGEIVEVRMMMDSQTGKNKGYAFLRYREAAQAKKAVSEFSKVEICGKLCGAAPLEGNDTIFLGNIDKKWKKEDVMKVLQDIGIEKIDTVTVMIDPHNADTNRGFAFLELETNKDAHIAYRKLQKKDVFGIGRNIKVAWAEPSNDPDEEEKQKVKAVFVEGVPSSWHESRLREIFQKFGEIERIVHSRDIQSAKRKDFAFVNYTTREAAHSCIELFDNELTEDGSKVNIKVSLAKPVHKNKPNKGFLKSTNMEREKPKPMQREVKGSVSSYKSFKDHTSGGGDKKASTTNELLQVLREQAAWKQGQVGYARGPMVLDYSHMGAGGKRAFPSMGDTSYNDVRGYPRPRVDHSFPVSGPSYGAYPPGMPGPSLPYYQHSSAGYSGSHYGMPEYSSTFQHQGVPPYGSNMYTRYR